MELDEKTIATLSGITTATLTTVMLKKGLRNVWLRGSKPLHPAHILHAHHAGGNHFVAPDHRW